MEDLEETFKINKISESLYIGGHPLKLPLPSARGVYGGNTIAQALLVAILSAPLNYVPLSFHSFFIAAGSADVPMEYHVVKLVDEDDILKRSIKAIQKGKVRFTALVSLVKKGKRSNLYQKPPESLHYKYDPENVNKLTHTGYVRNAFSEEFVDHNLVPEEKNMVPADRWINVWSGVEQKDNKFTDPRFNYVGLGGASDAVFLTTLARILHAPWNPTESQAFDEVDLEKDARMWMSVSLNALHIFHYNAMSLDHHMYFHVDDASDFDIADGWLTFNYQARRVLNNRTLVRGFFYTREGKLVATVAQEGLTMGFKGFDMIPKI